MTHSRTTTAIVFRISSSFLPRKCRIIYRFSFENGLHCTPKSPASTKDRKPSKEVGVSQTMAAIAGSGDSARYESDSISRFIRASRSAELLA